jgi:hypothetical protein
MCVLPKYPEQRRVQQLLVYDNSPGQNICVQSRGYLRKSINELELEMVKSVMTLFAEIQLEGKET